MKCTQNNREYTEPFSGSTKSYGGVRNGVEVRVSTPASRLRVGNSTSARPYTVQLVKCTQNSREYMEPFGGSTKSYLWEYEIVRGRVRNRVEVRVSTPASRLWVGNSTSARPYTVQLVKCTQNSSECTEPFGGSTKSYPWEYEIVRGRVRNRVEVRVSTPASRLCVGNSTNARP